MTMKRSMLMAAAVATVAGCGGSDALSREEFGNRLQAIEQRESARFGSLAQQVKGLKPDRTLPPDIKQGMTEVAAGHRRAADELSDLDPPEGAEDAIGDLIAALRERADAFEQAAQQEEITLRQVEQDRRIPAAGEKIDEAFERLDRAGFRPARAPSSATPASTGTVIGIVAPRSSNGVHRFDVTRLKAKAGRITGAAADRVRAADVLVCRGRSSALLALETA